MSRRSSKRQQAAAGETAESAALSRREMIQVGAGAILAAPLLKLDDALRLAAVVRERLARGAPPLFFTPREFGLVDELTELIIPTDEHSPGARAALVAAYIDARLAEAFEDERRELWRSGLALVDTLSRNLHGRVLLEATLDQRNAVLARMARNEAQPQAPEEKFFRELKEQTVRAYYTSKIGIQREMEYKGNKYLDQFAGYDAK